MVKVILPLTKKRREPPEALEPECEKRRKMDRNVKVQCGKILRTLMTHCNGPIFNQPVDPVALCIPDYFSIISHPMDLGTVKRRLDGDIYFDAEEFAADIRLTFSNAMLYNPPNNGFHLIAKEMNDLFNRSWETLKAKWTKERKDVKNQGSIVNGGARSTENAGKGCNSLHMNTSLSSEEKTSIVESKTVRQQSSIVNGRARSMENGGKVCNSLHMNTSISSEEKTSTVESKTVGQQGFTANSRAKKTEHIMNKAHKSPAMTPMSTKEKSSMKDNKVRQQCFIPNDRTKNTEDTSKACLNSTAKTSIPGEEKTLMCDEEKTRLKQELMEALKGDLTGPLRGFLRKYGLICSNKEKIETVFGSFGNDTLWALKRVVKASLATNMVKGKEDSVKMQHEGGRPKSQQLEEKSNIEARIRAARAAKEALIENAKSELQMRRNRERERVEMMERTAIMDDNLSVLRELEKLCQCSLSCYYSEYYGVSKSPLEKIGLRLKEEFYAYEYIDDDPILYDDLEDGEIIS